MSHSWRKRLNLGKDLSLGNSLCTVVHTVQALRNLTVKKPGGKGLLNSFHQVILSWGHLKSAILGNAAFTYLIGLESE